MGTCSHRSHKAKLSLIKNIVKMCYNGDFPVILVFSARMHLYHVYAYMICENGSRWRPNRVSVYYTIYNCITCITYMTYKTICPLITKEKLMTKYGVIPLHNSLPLNK